MTEMRPIEWDDLLEGGVYAEIGAWWIEIRPDAHDGWAWSVNGIGRRHDGGITISKGEAKIAATAAVKTLFAVQEETTWNK